MNQIIVTGRIANDVVVKQNGEIISAAVTLAVQSPFSKDVYFPTFWAKAANAEFLGKYGKKGKSFEIVGHIVTQTKKVDEKNFTTTYLQIDKVNFAIADSKKSQEGDQADESVEEPQEEPIESKQAPVEQKPKAEKPVAKPAPTTKPVAKTTTTTAVIKPKAQPTNSETIVDDGDDMPF